MMADLAGSYKTITTAYSVSDNDTEIEAVDMSDASGHGETASHTGVEKGLPEKAYTTSFNEPSEISINKNITRLNLQPTRFPSLTFVSQPTYANSSSIPNHENTTDRSTSIKNANLKSELIVSTDKHNRKSKDHLFNSVITGPTPMAMTATNSYMVNMDTSSSTNSVLKGGSSTTLGSVYTDAHSTLENYREPYDEEPSLYQQSVFSNQHESNALNLPNVKNHTAAFPANTEHQINAHLLSTVQYQPNHKRETESFIYNDDINSVDILSLNEHKLHRKLSNGGAFMNRDHNRENPLANIPDLDFLDTNSIATTVTNGDAPAPNFMNKSPSLKRQPFNSNLSVSPTYSKVRQVSQKIFNQHGTNNCNYSKIHLNRHPNHDDFGYFSEEESDNEMRNFDTKNDNGGAEEFTEDGAGFTDAESFLAQPFKSRANANYCFSQPNKQRLRHNEHNVGSLQQKKRPGTKNNYGSTDSTSNALNEHRYFDLSDEYSSTYGDVSNSPHDYKSMYYKQNLILKILLHGIYIFVMFVIMASIFKVLILTNCDNSIKKFEIVKLDNVLISDDILLIDVFSRARNVNLQDINIWDMDLDIFLITDEDNLNDEAVDSNIDVTILLGNTERFLTPLKFTGILNLPSWKNVWRAYRNADDIGSVESIGQLKLYKPGKNFVYQDRELNNQQWSKILKSKFKIILRGNLKYKLPFLWQNEFISISNEIEIVPSI